MRQGHTAEPWKTDGVDVVSDTVGHIATANSGDKTEEADAARIVACVNACQGIPDPETTVRALVDKHDNQASETSEPEELVEDLDWWANTAAVQAISDGEVAKLLRLAADRIEDKGSNPT